MLPNQYQAAASLGSISVTRLKCWCASARLPLLLEDDAPAEVSVRVVRVALQDAGEQIEGLVEVARSGLAPGFLGLLGLDAAVIQERDRQVDRAGNPAGRAAVDFAEGLDGLADTRTAPCSPGP